MADSHEVTEGPLYQGEDEIIAYTLDVSNIGDDPTAVVVVVKDMYAAADVTDEVMPTNSPTVEGNVITLSPLRDLTRNRTYRVEVQFVSGGNTFEPYFVVHGRE
jgi:hypothetical protein